MTKTQIILIVVCTIFFVQCQTKTDKPKSIDSNIDSDSLKYFKTDISLTGTGESGIASYYLNWNISIIDNDSIIMLSTLKKDENDVRLNNRQYFGRLIESEKYSYEIKVSEFVAIDGCNKPNNRFLDTDTIPFYIDSTLFNKVSYWKLITDQKRDTLKINKTNFLYKTNLKDYETDIVMSLLPNEKSGYFPATIKSGLRCGIYLTDRINSSKYYLNKVDGKYELITDRTIPNGMEGKECDYCIKKVKLDLK
ncbi:MAG: hypothetical protein ACI9JT_002003 [Polaribacter sp.]|jgi:hypothetical protein